MNALFRHLAAALLLLTFSASYVEAVGMATCAPERETTGAPSGHSHEAPESDGGGDGPERGETNECPIPSMGIGCAVASLPAVAGSDDLPLILRSCGASDPVSGYSLLLVRDRFHPPQL